MNELALLLDEYLATRRALGTRLELPARLLKRFVAFAERHETAFITTECALQWATEARCATGSVGEPSRHGAPLRPIRPCRRPASRGPPPGLLPQRYRRRQPYLYRHTEITELIAAAQELSAATPELMQLAARRLDRIARRSSS